MQSKYFIWCSAEDTAICSDTGEKNWLYWSYWKKIICSSQILYFPRIIIAVFHWCLLSQLYNSFPDTSMPHSKSGSFQGNLALNSGNSLHFSLYFPVYPSVLATKYNPDERDIADCVLWKLNLSFFHQNGALSCGCIIYCPPSSVSLDIPKYLQYATIKLQTDHRDPSIKVDYRLSTRWTKACLSIIRHFLDNPEAELSFCNDLDTRVSW